MCKSLLCLQAGRERETDRHVVLFRGEHHGRWDCMTRMSTLSNHRRLGRPIDGLAPSFLHAGATKFSALQVGQKYQKSGHIDQQSTKWQWNMCCYRLCLSPFLGLNNYDLTAYWDYMNPNIPNPVITEWAHQSSYYLLLCWHPESIAGLLILKELSINGQTIMNSIIRERAMFWSCWVDNKGAAISGLPPRPPTTAP